MLFACSTSVTFSPAQANCLSLGEINSPQLVLFVKGGYPLRNNVSENGCMYNFNLASLPPSLCNAVIGSVTTGLSFWAWFFLV